MILTQNRTALVSGYLSETDLFNRESTSLYAAKKLRYYLDRMTCATFQIEEGDLSSPGIYIGNICHGRYRRTQGGRIPYCNRR